MNNSNLLYYKDGYLKETTATILAVKKLKKYDAIILDQTIFYAEGGGQPGDRGTIENYKVVDTQIIEQEICHLVEPNHSLEVNSLVKIKIDWSHRYDYMQQHSAQHLLSGTFYNLFKIGTVSVHLGTEDFSIELDDLEIDEQTILKVEEVANEAVCSNGPVRDATYTKSEIEKLNLRREVKVSGDIRVVKLANFDQIACGGVHVKNLSEIKYIQFLRTEKIRGHLRTFWIAGNRSINLIRKNKEIVDTSGTLLSRPSEKIVEAIKELQRQFVDCNYHYNVQSVKLAKLLFEKEAIKIGDIPVAVFDATGFSEKEYKALAEVLLELKQAALAVLREQENNKIQWMVALKVEQVIPNFFERVKSEALLLIDGKGGGKNPLYQGVATKGENKKAFLNQMSAIFKQILSP